MVQPIRGQSNYPIGRSKSDATKHRRSNTEERPVKPKQAHENFIPSPESLSTLIRSALASLKDGSVWDRGSIVNLNV